MDDDHRVLLPRLAGQLVPRTPPEVDDLLPVVIRTAGAAQFSALDEVIDKRLAYRREARAHVSVDENAFQ